MLSINAARGTVEARFLSALREDIAEWQEDTGELIGDLAKAIGENPSTLTGYLNGHARIPWIVAIKIIRLIGGYRAQEEILDICNTAQDGTCNMAELLESVASTDDRSSKARTAILASMGDGMIDPHELASCEAKLRDQHAAHRRLVIALRQYSKKKDLPSRRAPTLKQTERLAQ